MTVYLVREDTGNLEEILGAELDGNTLTRILDRDNTNTFHMSDDRCVPGLGWVFGKKEEAYRFIARDAQLRILPPSIGTEWLHKSGERYVVTDVLNLRSTSADYPSMVAYQRLSDGTKWARPLSKWYQSFELDPGAVTTGLKTFNYEAARSGEPICDSQGHPARLIATDRLDGKPLVALLKDGVGESIVCCNLDGSGITRLYMAPKKRVKYAKVTTNHDSVILLGNASDTNDWPGHKVARIEWEE